LIPEDLPRSSKYDFSNTMEYYYFRGVPQFYIFLNPNNDDNNFKSFYITNEYEHTITELHFASSGPTLPFYTKKCTLLLNNCGWRFMGDYNTHDKKIIRIGSDSIAYPKYVSLDDLNILFPNCSTIQVKYHKAFDVSNLIIFSNLHTLYFETKSCNFLNGIEFLDSLRDLHLKILCGSSDTCDLSILKHLKLRKLTMFTNMQICKNLDIESLKELKIDGSYIQTLENINVPNLKLLTIPFCQNNFVSTFKIPDGCKIYLLTRSETEHQKDEVKRQYPDMNIEIVKMF
jgi:hypothetical protein